MQEQAIDMVLTDYCMPEMTGYDLLKAIKVLLLLLLQDQSVDAAFLNVFASFLHFCMCLSLTLQITAKLRRHCPP